MTKKNITLTEKQLKIVEDAAKQYGLSDAAVIRLIIEKFGENKEKLIR